jgi:hypothetical protein
MNILSQVTKAMQAVLTEAADLLAYKTGFIKRLRKLTGSGFIQTLVFGWLKKPDSTLEELCQTAASLGFDITPQGLSKRFTQEASDFIKETLESAVGIVIESKPVLIPLLMRFKGVYIQDSSINTLPDSLAVIWPGCGGSTSKNTSSSLKIQIRLDLNTGSLAGPYFQPGYEQDKISALFKESLPPGSLRMTDLGYFSLKNFKEVDSQGVYWLSRVKSQCNVVDIDGKQWDLLDFLKKHCIEEMGMPVFLGVEERVPCRILAVRVPDKVAMVRRCKLISEAKREGKPVSEKLLSLASWAVLCTNVPPEMLSLNEAFALIRARWQIEMIFKLWKSHGKIDEWRSEDPWRILCEVYAKLLAMVIQHWIFLTSCWEYPDRSIFKAAKTIQGFAASLAVAFALGTEERLYEILGIIGRCLSVGCRINKSKAKTHTYQLLMAFG